MVSGKKNVVSESYDEIVFTDPTNSMYHLLTNTKSMMPAIRHEPGMDCEFKVQWDLYSIFHLSTSLQRTNLLVLCRETPL